MTTVINENLSIKTQQTNQNNKFCQIFISYRRNGGDDLAFLLQERLTSVGYNVFFDTKTLRDENYEIAIKNNIINCTDFLLILSPKALDNCCEADDWVAKEIKIALDNKRHIVPVMKVGFDFPPTLPERLKEIINMNAVNFPTGYFNEAYERLSRKFLHSTINESELPNECNIKYGLENNVPAIINDYGLVNEIGTDTILENPRAALEYYKSAAEKGSEGALYNIGDIYEKCADNLMLASRYDISYPTNIKSQKDRCEYLINKAKEYFSKADNYAPALYRLGVLYEKNREKKEAFKYYKKAADKNYAPALNAAGYYYQHGLINGENNIENAVKCYKAAADQGLSAAVYNYARMLEKNADADTLLQVKLLYQQAFFSPEPVPQAAHALGRLYLAENNSVYAKHYYELALESGYYPASQMIEKINKNITSSRINY